MIAASPPLLWISEDELQVEAGGYGELFIGLSLGEPAVEAEPGSENPVQLSDDEDEGDYVLQVLGLPPGWCTLSRERLGSSLQAGEKVLLVIHPPRGHRLDLTGDYRLTIRASGPGGAQLQAALSLSVLPPRSPGRAQLAEFLPVIYRNDDFTRRFLMIFQSLIGPIEGLIDTLPQFLDPDVSPAETLPYLARWTGIELTPGMDEADQRRLIREAAAIAQWRGTRTGMAREMSLRLGGRALVVENFDGMRLGGDAALGLNTSLGRQRDGSVFVTFVPAPGHEVAPEAVEQVVEELKPAHAGQVVRVAASPVSSQEGRRG